MIGQGKKWARVVLLVLFVLGILVYPLTLMAIFKSNLLLGVLSVFQALLQIVALVYLFSPASTQWFNHVHSFVENEA
jgi:cellulose synthase/poly-beta-1,6-N-acetylglucosamine synthase-like glycosyltransferase